MTLIQIVQEFCRRQGIAVPAVVTTSTDETALQIWGLANETITDIADRQPWAWLRTRTTFVHANGADYQALDLSTITGYKGIVPKTLWSTDIRLPVAGPATAEQWAQLMVLQTAPAQYTYRLYGGSLYIYPAPAVPASSPFSFEYYSEFPVQGTSSFQRFFQADSDQSRIPDRLILSGLRWRWKKEKQQAYAEEMREYEVQISNEAGRETDPGDLRLDTPDPENRVVGPGLLIAAGNWNVP